MCELGSRFVARHKEKLEYLVCWITGWSFI